MKNNIIKLFFIVGITLITLTGCVENPENYTEVYKELDTAKNEVMKNDFADSQFEKVLNTLLTHSYPGNDSVIPKMDKGLGTKLEELNFHYANRVKDAEEGRSTLTESEFKLLKSKYLVVKEGVMMYLIDSLSIQLDSTNLESLLISYIKESPSGGKFLSDFIISFSNYDVNKGLTITKYKGSSDTAIIPESIAGIPVGVVDLSSSSVVNVHVPKSLISKITVKDTTTITTID